MDDVDRLRVELTHAYADLEELRSSYRNLLQSVAEQLAEVPVALSRSTPKVAASVAVIDEVVSQITKALKK